MSWRAPGWAQGQHRDSRTRAELDERLRRATCPRRICSERRCGDFSAVARPPPPPCPAGSSRPACTARISGEHQAGGRAPRPYPTAGRRRRRGPSPVMSPEGRRRRSRGGSSNSAASWRRSPVARRGWRRRRPPAGRRRSRGHRGVGGARRDPQWSAADGHPLLERRRARCATLDPPSAQNLREAIEEASPRRSWRAGFARRRVAAGCASASASSTAPSSFSAVGRRARRPMMPTPSARPSCRARRSSLISPCSWTR